MTDASEIKRKEVTLSIMQMKAGYSYRMGRIKQALTAWTVAANYAEAIGNDEVAAALRERVVALTPKG